MTFLEIVRKARLLSGIQGTGPVSVTTATGIEADLVQFAKDGYVDIQNLREEWPFRESSQSFVTQPDKSSYTLTDIFVSTSNLKKYKKDSFVINALGRNRHLRQIDDEQLELKYLNDTSVGIPHEYSIVPRDNSVVLKKTPNDLYSVTFKYYLNPEILSTDVQVPTLPVSFHDLIAYKAVEKMAVHLSNPEIYRSYATEASRMTGELMRNQLKPKRMCRRSLT